MPHKSSAQLPHAISSPSACADNMSYSSLSQFAIGSAVLIPGYGKLNGGRRKMCIQGRVVGIDSDDVAFMYHSLTDADFACRAKYVVQGSINGILCLGMAKTADIVTRPPKNAFLFGAWPHAGLASFVYDAFKREFGTLSDNVPSVGLVGHIRVDTVHESTNQDWQWQSFEMKVGKPIQKTNSPSAEHEVKSKRRTALESNCAVAHTSSRRTTPATSKQTCMETLADIRHSVNTLGAGENCLSRSNQEVWYPRETPLTLQDIPGAMCGNMPRAAEMRQKLDVAGAQDRLERCQEVEKERRMKEVEERQKERERAEEERRQRHRAKVDCRAHQDILIKKIPWKGRLTSNLNSHTKSQAMELQPPMGFGLKLVESEMFALTEESCDEDSCETVRNSAQETRHNESAPSAAEVKQQYVAEATGYLTLQMGDYVVPASMEPCCGDDGCRFQKYVYGWKVVDGNRGWLPVDVLGSTVWQVYVNESGQPWLHEEESGRWCYA